MAAIKEKRCVLHKDKIGMWWDLALYVPTVVFLLSIAFKFWYSSNQDWTYILLFAATYFFIAGANRILKVRLMILPDSPVVFEVNKQRILLELRSKDKVELVKNVRYFADFVGKSFAVSGMDLSGKKKQYVFSRGQFTSDTEFSELREFLKIYA